MLKYEKEIRELLVATEQLTEEIDDIKEDTSLQMAGINSITFVQFIVSMEDKLDIQFPPERLNIERVGTIKSLSEIVEEIKG